MKTIPILALFIMLSCKQEEQRIEKEAKHIIDPQSVVNYSSPSPLDTLVDPMNSVDDSIMNNFIAIGQNAIDFPGDNSYLGDAEGIPNILRPKRSYIKKLKFPIIDLIGYWGGFKDEPVNDFAISAKSFDVAEYEGEGQMPYIMYKDSIIIFYNDGVRLGRILNLEKDTLSIKWKDYDYDLEYLRWN